MPARTYLIFGDIEGKLDVLRVECTKCSRKGRYRVGRLKRMRPDSAQKSRPIDPVFRADSVVLAISAEKDGKLRLVYAGWDDTKVV